MTLTPGSKLGPYEIAEPLGAGGMGVVYRARDPRLGREVAIKVLPPEQTSNPGRLIRFEQEARAASALNHPNIITIYEVDHAGDTVYLVMERVMGKTLREVLASGSLPLKKALEIGARIADGLAKAHAAGIVHRDLKPENVMVSKEGFVKILDFGLAKLLPGLHEVDSRAATAPVTAIGAVIGTVGYMSPEQAQGASAEFRADQFALGLLLYEMVTGQRAFQRPSTAQTLAAIIEDEPRPIHELNPKIPAAVRWIVERCLAKEPENRYDSTRDLARDVQRVHDHLQELDPGPLGMRPGPAAPSHWMLPATLWALAGALLGAVASYGLLRPEATLPPVLRTLTFSGHDVEPALSPDGSTLVFTSDREGKDRIWLRQLAGGSEAPLTSGPDSAPRFSRDGSTVLFVHHPGAGIKPEIYRIPAVGGDARKILSDASEADWAPDGRRVVFIREIDEQGTLGTTLGVVNADGEDEHVLRMMPNEILRHPRWSPDGGFITVSTETQGVSEGSLRHILLLRSDGSEVRAIDTPFPGGPLSAVAWLDGGRYILYAMPESTASVLGSMPSFPSSRVIRQNVDSGKAQILCWLPTLSRTIEVIHDGNLLFDSLVGKENLREFDSRGQRPGINEHWDILTRGGTTDRQPTYSPDGAWLAFTSNRSGNLDVWLMSVKDRSVRRVTDHPDDDWDPAFTGDGRRLLWTSRRSGHFEIWMENLDGSEPRKITNDGRDAENATESRDGRWIIYNSGNPDKRGVWRIHPDGTEAARLVAGTTAWPEISPDGHYALYTLAGALSRIRVVRVQGGAEIPFEIQAIGGGYGRARWLPDGRAIAFTDLDPRGVSGVFLQDFVPGRDTSITRRQLAGFDPDSQAESFGFSPDGSRLVIASIEGTQTLMVAENVPGLQGLRRPHRD